MFEVYCIAVLCFIAKIRCRMQGYIVGGELAQIVDYPYSTYLRMICAEEGIAWLCGGSILNQDLILTAGHCIVNCPNGDRLKIIISVGDSRINQGQRTTGSDYICHENYNDETVTSDIGLVKTKHKLDFSHKASRVAILRHPPESQTAEVAGWGLIDDENSVGTLDLMRISQALWPHLSCVTKYGHLPPNTFCASSIFPNQYLTTGDSGSPLVIEGYIQIGIVSYKRPHISKSVIVYTNVSGYYDWIHNNANKLFCT